MYDNYLIKYLLDSSEISDYNSMYSTLTLQIETLKSEQYLKL